VVPRREGLLVSDWGGWRVVVREREGREGAMGGREKMWEGEGPRAWSEGRERERIRVMVYTFGSWYCQ
jgi:hypothetical protein